MDQRRVLLAGAVLWMAAIGTGVGVSAEAVAPGVVSHPAAAAVDGAASAVSGSVALANADGTVRANLSTDSASVAARTDDTAVSLRGLDASGEGSAVVEHDAIDPGTAGSVATGLCAAGLDGPDSPVGVEADGANGSVRVEFSDSRRPTVGPVAASDVVARCSDGGTGADSSTPVASADSAVSAVSVTPEGGA
jgi:hypothetical protein